METPSPEKGKPIIVFFFDLGTIVRRRGGTSTTDGREKNQCRDEWDSTHKNVKAGHDMTVEKHIFQFSLNMGHLKVEFNVNIMSFAKGSFSSFPLLSFVPLSTTPSPR